MQVQRKKIFQDMLLMPNMVCDKVTHKFNNALHTMDLTLVGGDFISG